LLAIGRLEIVNGSDRRRAAVDGGFLHVFADRVDVLAEHADLESDIDLAREEDRRARAEQRLEREKSEDARAELAKAVTRIDLRSSRS
ncbi:MAG TPA: F0F1 ATP synthase subunit epsilon, partial [Myxococcaceae bacterium]